MTVDYDQRHQRLVVRDDQGQVIFTMDGPSPDDVSFWKQAAERLPTRGAR